MWSWSADPPTLQTDGQTDGQHAISIPRYALVHRAVKIVESKLLANLSLFRVTSTHCDTGWYSSDDWTTLACNSYVMCSDKFEAKININVHFYMPNVMDPTGRLLSPRPLCVESQNCLNYTMVWHDSVRSSLCYYMTERTTVKYIVWWAKLYKHLWGNIFHLWDTISPDKLLQRPLKGRCHLYP